MLINTVILFLRDVLPIFILCGFLLSLQPRWQNWLWQGVSWGLLATAFIFPMRSVLVTAFNGAGYEVLKIVCLVAFYGCIIAIMLLQHASRPRALRYTLQGCMAIFILPHGNDFAIFLSGFWAQQHLVLSTLMGMLLGAGICVSAAILLYITMRVSKFGRFRLILLAVFTAGQIAYTSVLLEQIDWLQSGPQMWNATRWITDQSALGHLLNALTGYEATPSLAYLVVYLAAIVLACLTAYKTRNITPRARYGEG